MNFMILFYLMVDLRKLIIDYFDGLFDEIDEKCIIQKIFIDMEVSQYLEFVSLCD